MVVKNDDGEDWNRLQFRRYYAARSAPTTSFPRELFTLPGLMADCFILHDSQVRHSVLSKVLGTVKQEYQVLIYTRVIQESVTRVVQYYGTTLGNITEHVRDRLTELCPSKVEHPLTDNLSLPNLATLH